MGVWLVGISSHFIQNKLDISIHTVENLIDNIEQ